MNQAPLAACMRGRASVYGTWTLYVKEVRRFAFAPAYTIVGPTVMGLLFFTVFVVAAGEAPVAGLPRSGFLAPGLMIMAAVAAAFDNPATSLVGSKLHGNIADELMAPLGAGAFVLAYVAAGATRGILVATLLGALLTPFVEVAAPVVAAGFLLGVTTAMAAAGVIAGLWAPKWDHLAAAAAFVVTPLSFLSGAFYDVERLAPPWAQLTAFNPVFHMVDGFRYGMTGIAAGAPVHAGTVVAGTALIATLVAWALVARGYHLKE